MPAKARLITFKISHYCEKARWALDHIGFPYVEECHLPLLHRLKTNPLGGSSVPVLLTQDKVLTDSQAILQHLDTLAQPHLKLYPDAPRLRAEVETLEATFDRELGVETRQWGYYHVLQNRPVMQQLWTEKIPKWEQAFFPILFPLTRRLIYTGYNVNRESAIAAYHRTQHLFKTISDRLSDGRRYLVGDHFSAADLGFASLAAPSVMPPEYGGRFPTLNQLPDEMVEQIQTLRETIAGQYVLRLYQEDRYC
jgi:glutathione S-transferase